LTIGPLSYELLLHALTSLLTCNLRTSDFQEDWRLAVGGWRLATTEARPEICARLTLSEPGDEGRVRGEGRVEAEWRIRPCEGEFSHRYENDIELWAGLEIINCFFVNPNHSNPRTSMDIHRYLYM
jgi:hypothetical protein